MSWRQAGRRDLRALLDYLLLDEAAFVSFTSRLRSGTRGYTGGYEVFLDAGPAGEVRECFLVTFNGLMLPALAATGDDRAGLRSLLASMRPLVHSLMGLGRCVTATEELFPLPPTTRVEYFLMTLSPDEQHPVLPVQTQGLRVRKADQYDAESLFPLQKGYELEEVVITPSHFNESQCMKNLRAALREQLVFVAERDGVPVAKAATNARGYGVDQIGGVYTVPEERGRGLGRTVVAALLKGVFAEKQAACLFVKKHNRSAIALYDRLGFTPATDYVISYYGI